MYFEKPNCYIVYETIEESVLGICELYSEALDKVKDYAEPLKPYLEYITDFVQCSPDETLQSFNDFCREAFEADEITSGVKIIAIEV